MLERIGLVLIGLTPRSATLIRTKYGVHSSHEEETVLYKRQFVSCAQ